MIVISEILHVRVCVFSCIKWNLFIWKCLLASLPVRYELRKMREITKSMRKYVHEFSARFTVASQVRNAKWNVYVCVFDNAHEIYTRCPFNSIVRPQRIRIQCTEKLAFIIDIYAIIYFYESIFNWFWLPLTVFVLCALCMYKVVSIHPTISSATIYIIFEYTRSYLYGRFKSNVLWMSLFLSPFVEYDLIRDNLHYDGQSSPFVLLN